MHYLIKKTFLVAGFMVLVASAAVAQRTTYSPYSKYGIGSLLYPSSNAEVAFGGGMGLSGNTYYLANNTAAIARGSAPTFDWGVVAQKTDFETANQKASFKSGSVHHFFFGMPVKRGWGLQFGIAPESQIGYNVVETQTVEDTLTATTEYEGQGGVNKAMVGFAKELFNQNDSLSFSVGADFGYFFGNRALTKKVSWAGGDYFFDTKLSETSLVSGVGFKLSGSGFWQQEKQSFGLGFSYEPASELTFTTDEALYNLETTSIGSEFEKDTSFFNEGVENKYKTGANFKVGFAYSPQESWMFTIDYWSKTQGELEQMAAGSRVSLSASFQPVVRYSQFTSFFKSIRYSINAYTGNAGLTLNGEQLTEFGTGFALMIPLKKSNSGSQFVIGANYREFGTTNNNLLKETSFQGFVGLTLKPSRLDRWFVKRKYN